MIRNVDTFRGTAMTFTSRRDEIASGPDGVVFWTGTQVSGPHAAQLRTIRSAIAHNNGRLCLPGPGPSAAADLQRTTSILSPSPH